MTDTTPTTPHRAAPKHWVQCKETAGRWDDATAFHCLLELRDRLAAAEQRINELEAGATCPHVVSSDEGTSYCGLAEQVAQQEQQPDNNPNTTGKSDSPYRSLVALTADVLAEYDMTLPAAPTVAARAAIRAVAEWMRSQDLSTGDYWAGRLEQEAER